MNNFGQVDADSTQALFRIPFFVEKLSAKNILSIAAGGSHSFAIGAILRGEDENSSEFQSLLTRKFSVAAQKGLGGPIAAETFLTYLEGTTEGLNVSIFFIYDSFTLCVIAV
jgi:hypothetical protein